MTKRFCLWFFSLLSLIAAFEAHGAACCGGGSSAPSLILGDDRALFTTSYAQARVTDDVGSDGVWRKRDGRDLGETLRLDAAHIFRDRWQAGAGVPLTRRSRGGETATGVGDATATLGYEYLPEWDYHPIRPRGLGFAQLTLPTGKSPFESDSPLLLDARGRGFWAVGMGTVLTKITGAWDLAASLEAHRAFARKFSNASASGTLKPGFGARAELAAGWSRQAWRLGYAVAWSREDAVEVEGTIPSAGTEQRIATGTASASYAFPGEWAATLSYSDQTAFGAPVSASLEKTVGVSLQKRWLR